MRTIFLNQSAILFVMFFDLTRTQEATHNYVHHKLTMLFLSSELSLVQLCPTFFIVFLGTDSTVNINSTRNISSIFRLKTASLSNLNFEFYIPLTIVP